MIIWLASYPRSGNTFVRTILNHVFGVKTYSIYGDKLDIAADEATKKIVGHQELPEGFDYIEARQSDELYFIKTHEPYNNHFAEDKAIYILRDGREATVSYYHYLRDFSPTSLSLLEIINGYTRGSWGDHYYSWLREQSDSVILLRFEDIIKSPESAIKKIVEFTSLKPSKSKVPEFADLHNMNPKFFRSGEKNSFIVNLNDFEQKYFWLVNGHAMRDAGYIDHAPKVDNRAELDELFFKHITLTQRRDLKYYEEQLNTLNQHLSQKDQIIQYRDNQLKQKHDDYQEKIEQLLKKHEEAIENKNKHVNYIEDWLKRKDVVVKQKNQHIDSLEQQLNAKDAESLQISRNKDRQLEEKDQQLRDKDIIIQNKDRRLEENDLLLRQINQQLQKSKNDFAFKLGKIIRAPLLFIKKIFLKPKQ